jgi:hypothetical protein
MRRLSLLIACAAAALTPACGLAPHAAAPIASRMAALDANYNGAYLAVNFKPSAALEHEAAQLRTQLGFLDMAHAIPPRSGEELHVTVGFFPKLNLDQAKALSARFRGRHAQIVIDGYGVANQQVAYFTIKGIDEGRQDLQGLKVPYDADDPHVTFGVCPANPRDVHHVAKKAQHPLPATTMEGEYHLMQGTKQVW